MVIERVGSGAMGVVYGAYDPELDRKVALKLLKPGQGVKEIARARLLREAKAMARLSHPNVVAVHDVGVFEDQVFLAMEFLNAGTIKSWLEEKPRTWREILKVFIRAGRGLEAAHAAGLVHRDFKPDNVLLDKDGRPRVVDFGIARQSSGGDDSDSGAGAGGDLADATAQFRESIRESSGNVKPLLTLTKTGTWVGTPAYMAPEQFMGERGDEKSDQFSFCVALYEALYGERPFAGDDVLSLSVNVTQETFKPLPKDRGVPTWVRRVVVRGVRSNPSARWESMAALIAALEDDPAVKLRRRLIVAGTIVAIGAVLVGAQQVLSRRHRDTEREIAAHLKNGEAIVKGVRERAGSARDLRARSFAAFDALEPETGESLWRQTRALVPAIDGGYDQAEQALETALVLDRERDEIRASLADLRYEHLLFAEDFRLTNKIAVLHERLAAVDGDNKRRKALGAPGKVVLSASPAPSLVTLERYDRDPTTARRIAKAIGTVRPGEPAELPPGSYRLLLSGPGLAPVTYPFEVRRGEAVHVDLALPPASAVPAGFVYIPPGEFWFGDADEVLRTQFFDTVPVHRRKTDGYLIARNETTYGEWIAFLNALPPAERLRHAPNVTTAIRGSLALRALPDDAWQLTFQPTTERHSAAMGEPILYPGRSQRGRQDWLRFPVAGISPADASRYVDWLHRRGTVPGARLCTELEWERAARGADDRLFPHGDDLEPDDANHDLTYGRLDSAYGPDMVGAHPVSRSPFGIDDLAGNVFEIGTSSERSSEMVIRGGAYYFKPVNARSTNREVVPPTFRDVTAGIRICASFQLER